MINGIQYLRAIAALLVVFHHTLYRVQVYGNGDFYPNITFGMAGVDVFFIISGFIIYYITTGRETATLDFAVSRFIRIIPNYWFWTIIFVIVYGIDDHIHLLKSLFFIPAYHPQFAHTPDYIWPPLIQGWTLNYEIFFYIVFALCIRLKSRILGPTVIFLLLLAAGNLFEFQSAPFLFYTSPNLLEFLVGIWLGWLYLSKFKPPVWSGLTLILIGAALFPALQHFPIRAGMLHMGSLMNKAIPALALVSGVLILEKHQAVPKWRLAMLVGNSSYSLYLCHVFVLDAWARIWRAYNFNLVLPDQALLLSAMLLSVMVGLVFYFILERPSLYALNRIRKSFHNVKSKAIGRPGDTGSLPDPAPGASDGPLPL